MPLISFPNSSGKNENPDDQMHSLLSAPMLEPAIYIVAASGGNKEMKEIRVQGKNNDFQYIIYNPKRVLKKQDYRYWTIRQYKMVEETSKEKSN